METLIHAAVCFATFLLIVLDDIRTTKAPFDDSPHKKFSFKKHWLDVKWDDMLVWLVLGGLGGMVIAGEGGAWILEKYFNLEGIAEAGLNNTLVIVFTFLTARPKRAMQLIQFWKK